MRFEDFENMRKNAIKWEMYQESLLRNIEFSMLIDNFNAYEERIGDSTKRFKKGNEAEDVYLWLDPKDKKVKRVEKANANFLGAII